MAKRYFIGIIESGHKTNNVKYNYLQEVDGDEFNKAKHLTEIGEAKKCGGCIPVGSVLPGKGVVTYVYHLHDGRYVFEVDDGGL